MATITEPTVPGLFPRTHQNNQEDDVWDEDEEVPSSDVGSRVDRGPEDVLAPALVLVEEVVVDEVVVQIQVGQMVDHRVVRGRLVLVR